MGSTGEYSLDWGTAPRAGSPLPSSCSAAQSALTRKSWTREASNCFSRTARCKRFPAVVSNPWNVSLGIKAKYVKIMARPKVHMPMKAPIPK